MSKVARPIEYLHKKNTYLFPAGSKVFLVGDNVFTEINNKKVVNLNPYLRAQVFTGKGYECQFGLPITEVGSNLHKEYQPIADFFEENAMTTFLHFDYATGNTLPLCTFFRPLDFVKTGNLVQEIRRSLPFLINIFRRPLIHLKQAEIIQPIDAVKRVNHNTIRHLMRHTEDWQDFDKITNKVVPARLLTRVYEDDYSIYENVVFKALIDDITIFVRKRILYLTEILETFKESIQLDAVNRFNHQKYYLAIGKLYVGFYKMENSSEISTMLEALKGLYSQINSYKTRAVYTKNSNQKLGSGEIRHTNILTMHKDYKHVLNLSNNFKKTLHVPRGTGDFVSQTKSQENYTLFCQMLALFAAVNFNLICKPNDQVFDGKKSVAHLSYMDWKLNQDTVFNETLGFNVLKMAATHRSNKVNYLIIPMTHYLHDKKHYDAIVERLYAAGHVYDKYVFFIPFEEEDDLYDYNHIYNYAGAIPLSYAILPVSITEINSFRRAQKLLLEMMVNSNKDFDNCAFCGEKLVQEANGIYVCKKCRTGLRQLACQDCGKAFVTSFIGVKGKPIHEDLAMTPFFRQEKLFLFRNIVNNSKGKTICPYCGAANT